MIKVKAGIFDYNGTIFDDLESMFERIKWIFRFLGRQEPTIEEYREEIRADFMEFYRKRGVSLSRQAINKLLLRAPGIYPASIFAEVTATLACLSTVGVKLFLVSFRDIQALLDEINNLDIPQFFEEIHGSVNTKEQAIKSILYRHGFQPEEVFFVSDTEDDIRVGKSVGCISVAYLRGYHSPSQLLAANPDFTITGINGLLPIFADPYFEEYGNTIERKIRW